MKKIFCAFALLFFTLYAYAQETSPFVVGFETSISSKILNEQRKIWIHLPKGYKPKSGTLYPVIYVLDGDSGFHSTVAVTEHLSEQGLEPEMIVVGILHPNRMIDLTFGKDKEYPQINGGGEKFLDYVEKEVIPFIDMTYSTAPYRTFLGHSVGGLCVVHALIHRPYLFNSYISLDGALWWNNQELVSEAKLAIASDKYKDKTLFLAMSNRMEKDVDLKQVRKLKGDDTVLIRANLSIIDDFAKLKNPSLRLGNQYYPNDDHNSLILAAQYDALRYIFDFYRPHFYRSYYADPKFDVTSFYTEHYNNVSKKMGYLVKPDKSDLNNRGYASFRVGKHYDKSESFFKMLISNYPDDPNSYDSIGDLYVAKDDKVKAIEAFQKSLTLGNIPETKEKLDKLLEE